MTRFFVPSEEISQDTLLLTGENLRHARVLRIREGEKLLVSDGCGAEALCEADSLRENGISLRILERRGCGSEPSIHVSIYMAFPKADKLEHVIQKASELGADEIIAFPSSRCVSRPDARNLDKKLERWKKIALSAAEQSGRGRIPDVFVLDSWREALVRAGGADISILFYENEHARTLHAALNSRTWHSVSLMTGPEGGLTETETEQAEEAGLEVCTLGRRILRCETAPLCALSAVMYAAGEF